MDALHPALAGLRYDATMTEHVRWIQLPAKIERHKHAHPYAAVVLSGSYEEAGESGRWRVTAGDVLIHPAFSAHCDRVSPRNTRVLDIPLALDRVPHLRRGQITDPDALARIAERDPRAAAEHLIAALRPAACGVMDLPDQLAAELNSDRPPDSIARWAAAHGVARETLSRQFRALYEVSSARYRVEARARRAWTALVRSTIPFVELAHACGYADQAHLTRDVVALTGRTPGAWRRQSQIFKTSDAPEPKLRA